MVSTLSASLIRGCHPTFSCNPCNEDWYLMSIIDYYRIRSEYKHPNPATYWRYSYDMKWGWDYSITDFKTQSIKEYFLIKQLLHKKKLRAKQILLCVHRVLPCMDLTRKVKEYLFYTHEKEFKYRIMDSLRKQNPPTPLPKIQRINSLQVFIGRCKHYGFIHKDTHSCIISRKELFLVDLIECCRSLPRPHIHHPFLKIQDKKRFFSVFLVQVSAKDQEHYVYPQKTPLLDACHWNLTGIENDKYYKDIDASFNYLKERSIMDVWVSDLFGW